MGFPLNIGQLPHFGGPPNFEMQNHIYMYEYDQYVYLCGFLWWYFISWGPWISKLGQVQNLLEAVQDVKENNLNLGS